MLYRKSTRPALHIQTIHEPPHSCTTTFYDSESDEEESKAAMAHDYLHARSLTVAIPKSYSNPPCYPRRPNLAEILANTAPPPWTLSAFMAYLSQNHCLETLEFTMDASRYRKHYTKMANRNPGTPVSPKSEECAYVKMLWQRLLDAYIAPNGPREVNLPSDVRNSLMSLSDPHMPPHPSTLDQAVEKVYELMEESVLVPFLNSVYPQPAAHEVAVDDQIRASYGVYQQPASHPTHPTRNIPISSTPVTASHRASAPASYSRSLGPVTQHSRFASGPARFMNGNSSSYGSSNSDALTDDSGSASSPSFDPVTPPTTPPTGEYGGSWAAGLYGNGYTSAGGSHSAHSSAANSPKSSRGEHTLANATANQWKRVSSKLGWRRKSASQLREDAEMHPEQ